MRIWRLISVLTLLVVTHHAYSKDDASGREYHIPNSEVEGEPSTIVAGHVNVISGSFIDSTSDFVVASAQPLMFSRFYTSADWRGGSLCDSWNHSFPYSCQLNCNGHQYWIRPPESSGCTPGHLGNGRLSLDYKKKQINLPNTAQTFTPFDEIGLTNCGSGTIGGRTTIRNNIATWKPQEAGLTVRHGDGSERSFGRQSQTSKNVVPFDLFLRSEKLPNGNSIHYQYAGDKLTKMTATDSQGRELAWIECAYEGKTKQVMTASDGRITTYHLQHFRNKGTNEEFDRYHLVKAEAPHAPAESYAYSSHKVDYDVTKADVEKVIRKTGAGGQYLDVSYYKVGDNTIGDRYVPLKYFKHEAALCRVAKLEAPVGPNGERVITHRFFYNVPVGYPSPQYFEGSTDVRDALNHCTIYHYNWFQRPTQIAHYTGCSESQYKPHSHEHFYWGTPGQNNHYGNGTDLVCKSLNDANDNVRSCRCLEYDVHHNVTKEQLCGNLSGTGAQPTLDPKGIVTNTCERYVRTYTYSEDGFNLLTSETDSCTGKKVSYSYKKETDLLTAKLTHDASGQIILREFYDYDQAAVMTLSITDDGCTADADDLTGISIRLVKEVTPKQEHPCLGLPEVIDEYGIDPSSNEKIPIRRLKNHYTKEGWLDSQEHYGSDGVLAYTLHRQYDTFGNILVEKDGLGHLTHRRYDENGNKIYETKEGTGVEYHYTYDLANRLTSTRENHTDGTCLCLSNTYDVLGQLIASKDEFGNTTEYTYDEFGNQTSITLPDGTQKIFIYDIAGNCVESKDPIGNVTKTSYNIRSQPTEVTYPDRTSEQFVYNLDGTLASQRARNGMRTEFTYDVLGQIKNKKCLSTEGILLCETHAKYKGRLVVSETDANGNMTHYTYDHAGRKIKETYGNREVSYVYDALGRQHRTISRFGTNETDVSISCKEYDPLDRVVREWVEDSNGSLLTEKSFTYDVAGHCTSTTQTTQQGIATTYTEYDPRGHIIKVIDPLGSVTVSTYDYNCLDANGKRVLQITQEDPLLQRTITTYDLMGRVSQVEIINPSHVTIAKHHLTYDAVGNLISRVDTVYSSGTEVRQVTTHWNYNTMGQIEHLTEAVGTTEQRITRYHYNSAGQQNAIEMPDGIKLQFCYDGMGRITEYSSSDESFFYCYTYDDNGNVLSVKDGNGSTTLRKYDACNRMIDETLSNGLTLSYTYDGLSRPTHLHLPDESSIDYRYDALHLRTIDRLSPSGDSVYRHTYDSFDLANQVMSTTLANGVHVEYSWDNNSRPLGSTSDTWAESITGYDPVGNLTERMTQDNVGKLDYHYTYNDQYQLASETGAAFHHYLHDSLFNRMLRDHTSYATNVLNQLLQQGNTSYTYDKRGNLIVLVDEAGEHHYTYDGLNRLVSVEAPNIHVSYTYDAFNRRLSKTIHLSDDRETVQRYLYTGENEIGAVDQDGTLVELRVLGSGLGAEIGAAVAVELHGRTFIPQHDHNGNVVTLLDMKGQVQEVYRYSAFGEESIYGFPMEDNLFKIEKSTIGMSWRFSSKRVDPETGWIYFGRRYYAPSIGRWVTCDPIGFKGGPNLYAYVGNSPLIHIDLYGLYAQDQKGNQSRRSPSSPNRRSQNSRPSNRMEKAVKAPGRVIENLADCLPPGPRDLLKGIGRSFQGRPFFGCHYCRDSSSYGYDVPGFVLPDHALVVCTGQGNTWHEGEKFGQFVSEAYGGETVDGIYNNGRGQVHDTGKTLAMKAGARPSPVELFANALKRNYARMAANGHPNGVVDVFVTSAGAQVAWSARPLVSDEVAAAVQLRAYGPAKVIPDGTYGRVTNIASSRDPIPWLADPWGMIKGLAGCGTPVQFLPGSGWFDHMWTNETYSDHIMRQGESFQRNNRSIHP